MIAMGVIQAARDLGLRCPEDLSIVGFDDLEFAALLNPSLSSVFQPATNSARPQPVFSSTG